MRYENEKLVVDNCMMGRNKEVGRMKIDN